LLLLRLVLLLQLVAVLLLQLLLVPQCRPPPG
jgi:hypothetical protein